MKNNEVILNAKNKTVTLNFADQEFTIDLTEGDLHDSWNGITLKSGEVYDFNFSWQDECEPSVTLYKTFFEYGHLRTDFFEETLLQIRVIIGTKSDYFDLEFDTSLDCVYILFSAEKVKKLTTSSLNMLSDNKEDTDYIIAVDSNGATKTFY